MDPILASGLLNIGQKVISEVSGINLQDNAGAAQSSQSFADTLQASQSQGVSPASDLSSFLQANGVTQASDLQQLEKQLNIQLQNNPELAGKLSNLSQDDRLSLNLSEGNRFTLTSDKQGVIAELNLNTEAGQLAQKLHQLKALRSQSQQFPGANLGDMVNQLERQPLQTASWKLSNLQ